ncbi:hypothetical protein J7L02_03015 [Candidatus Woesearchaeota archaeon]|nr:hypothetical protein [Candidatus Woesearchaeota archaeon]
MPDLLKDKVYNFVKLKGLVIPLDVKKAFNLELLIASAVLSELVSDGKLKTTFLKYGGTPFYYVTGREELLVNLKKHLNEKDKQVFELLQLKKVLRDKDLTPLQRVALRNLKDFAKPLTVKTPDSEEVWWRWFLTPEEQALTMIKTFFESQHQDRHQEQAQQRQVKLQQEQELLPSEKTTTPMVKPVQQSLVEKKQLTMQRQVKKQKKHRLSKQELLAKARQYFNKKNLKVQTLINASKSQADFIVQASSNIGPVNVYCRFKHKKIITDADLASLIITAQSKNLPALLVTNGVLTKKASAMLKNKFENLKVDNF